MINYPIIFACREKIENKTCGGKGNRKYKKEKHSTKPFPLSAILG